MLSCILFAVLLWPSSSSSANEHSGGSYFSASTLQRGIESYLRAHLSSNDEVTFLLPLDDVSFAQTGVIATCQPLLQEDLHGRIDVVVLFQCNGQQLRSIRIPVKITRKQMVAITKHPLPRGNILTHHDIIYELRDVTNLISQLPDSVVGRQLLQSLPQGAVILQSHLLSPGGICAGETVTLTLLSNSIAIRTSAQALQNAVIGHTVKVRRNDTGVVLVGRVTANRNVVVDMSQKVSPQINQMP